MSKVVMHNVVSVDGFIADDRDDIGPLFDWYFNGDVPLSPDGALRMSRPSFDYVRPAWDDIGCMVIGRRLRASAALAGPHLHLQDWVLQQGAVHVDETGWPTSGEGRALWTATTPEATFLEIAEHCNREPFDALIGPYGGIVVSDRWNGFSHLDPHRRQVCWSHLQRDFRRHADGLAEQQRFGEHGLALTRQVFAAWRAYQHAHHDRARLTREIAPIQTELRALLEDASPKHARTRWHRRFANNLLKVWPALWTFTTTDGVEPTNNPAERALRAPVIHRKVSLGTQSSDGERFAERALSAAATCRLQHRSLFTYLSDLITAHNRGDPFPTLT